MRVAFRVAPRDSLGRNATGIQGFGTRLSDFARGRKVARRTHSAFDGATRPTSNSTPSGPIPASTITAAALAAGPGGRVLRRATCRRRAGRSPRRRLSGLRLGAVSTKRITWSDSKPLPDADRPPSPEHTGKRSHVARLAASTPIPLPERRTPRSTPPPRVPAVTQARSRGTSPQPRGERC